MSDNSHVKCFILCLIFGILLLSCNIDKCSKNLSFELDYHLFDHIYIEDKTYSELVNDALEGDSISIIELSTLKGLDGWAVYQNGMVILEIIEKISEVRYSKIINNLNFEEKQNIYSYIIAGIDAKEVNGHPSEYLRQKYPKLYNCLKGENESGDAVVVMQAENKMEYRVHETRHGGQVARGELKLDYSNYGASHEIDAYRAQFAANGFLDILPIIDWEDTRNVMQLSRKGIDSFKVKIYNINYISHNLLKTLNDFKQEIFTHIPIYLNYPQSWWNR